MDTGPKLPGSFRREDKKYRNRKQKDRYRKALKEIYDYTCPEHWGASFRDSLIDEIYGICKDALNEDKRHG